jgi:hypothetical protein
MIREISGALVGALLLLTAAGCAAPAPRSSAVSTNSTPATSTTSSTRATGSLLVTPPTTSTAVTVPWNGAGVRSVADLAPPATSPPAPSGPGDCTGGFQLLPRSPRTTSPSGGNSTTTFVVQYNGSAPCSTNPGFFGVTMTAADGTTLPIDSMPAGPYHPPLRIGPHQLVFGSIQWAVAPGRPQPTHLTFTLGDTPSVRSISIPVADVSRPPQSSSPAPQNAGQATAYGLLTSAAAPATLATLTAAMATPATVHVPSTLLYVVTLINTTNTAVPLVGCPQFAEQLSVVPLKTPTTVGAAGSLNCSRLPRAIIANSSVTMLMKLDTVGQVAGPGRLTWQLLDHGHKATAVMTAVTVQGN